jgi:hypothetical protein
MSHDAPIERPAIRCTFYALRGADLLFKRTVDLVDVPRVGERVRMWFTDATNVRGTVRDVTWTIPNAEPPAVNIQVELTPGDRKRFADRTPITEGPDGR